VPRHACRAFVALSCITSLRRGQCPAAPLPFATSRLMLLQKGLVSFQGFLPGFSSAVANFVVPALRMHFAVPRGPSSGHGGGACRAEARRPPHRAVVRCDHARDLWCTVPAPVRRCSACMTDFSATCSCSLISCNALGGAACLRIDTPSTCSTGRLPVGVGHRWLCFSCVMIVRRLAGPARVLDAEHRSFCMEASGRLRQCAWLTRLGAVLVHSLTVDAAFPMRRDMRRPVAVCITLTTGVGAACWLSASAAWSASGGGRRSHLHLHCASALDPPRWPPATPPRPRRILLSIHTPF